MFKYVLFCLVILMITSCKKDSAAITVAKKTNELRVMKNTFEDLEGNPVDIKDYKGKKVFLNFWATWCKPCVNEMSSLQQSKHFLEKENYVVLLASNESIKEIKSFKTETGYKLNFIRYIGAFSELKIYALPTTLIFNENGEEVAKITGVQNWGSPEMILKLKNIELNEDN